MRGFSGLLAIVLAVVPAQAQEAALEYQVKAAYLYNFIKFIEWPAGAVTRTLSICVAERNPFGSALDNIVRAETVGGHVIQVRVVPAPQADCQVVFVPRDVAAGEYLRAARAAPVLTVGEAADFIAMGGIINFVRDAGMIRFEIDQDGAMRAGLHISSRLLRLARPPERRGAR